MAKVKIFLEEGETREEVEESLAKSVNSQNSGDVHAQDTFQDPAMDDVAETMISSFSQIYQEMLQDVFQVLDQEYDKKW